MRLNFIIIFLFISSFSFSQVQNSLLFTRVLAELSLKENEIHKELVVDKILPYSTDKTVFVIPKYNTNEKDEFGHYFYEFDAYILLVENKSGKILNKFYESNAWTSDAINLLSIEIDTSLYLLNEQTRAFGIRINYTGSSRPNPYSRTDLSLFITKNNELKRILKDFSMNNFIGEWDTICSGEFEDLTSFINIDKTKNNGFYNIIVKQKIKKTQNIPTKGDCIEKVKSIQKSKTLKYNGEIYH